MTFPPKSDSHWNCPSPFLEQAPWPAGLNSLTEPLGRGLTTWELGRMDPRGTSGSWTRREGPMWAQRDKAGPRSSIYTCRARSSSLHLGRREPQAFSLFLHGQV